MSGASFFQPEREIILCVYTRLSSDAQGKRITHETQMRDIDAFIARTPGLPSLLPENHHKDTDRSASKEDIYRPGWERLLAFIAGIDATKYEIVLVGWAQDRCMRLLGDPAELANLIDRKRGRLGFATYGWVPTEKGTRDVMYILGAIAAGEAEKIGKRTRGGHETAAINGRAVSRAPYGYRRVYDDATGKSRQIVDENTAPVVKDIARRILDGESLRSIANDLNKRGIPAPGHGLNRRDPATREVIGTIEAGWESRKVRQTIMRKSNIGIRTHTTGSAKDGTLTEREYPGTWEPILDTDVFYRVCTILENPDRRNATHSNLTHLLSRLATCGVCKEKVWSNPAHTRRNKTVDGVKVQRPTYRVYRCQHGHTMKHEGHTDELVKSVMLDLFRLPNILELLGAENNAAVHEAREKEAVLENRRTELTAALSDPDAPMAALLPALKAVEAKLAAIRRAASETANAPAFLPLALADDKEAFWEMLPLDRKRSIIAASVTITMHPSPKRGRGAFDPDAIDVKLRIPHPNGDSE